MRLLQKLYFAAAFLLSCIRRKLPAAASAGNRRKLQRESKKQKTEIAIYNKVISTKQTKTRIKERENNEKMEKEISSDGYDDDYGF